MSNKEPAGNGILAFPRSGKTATASRRAYLIAGVVILLGLVAIILHLTFSGPKPVLLDVVMVDYRFEPDHLTFTHGVRYRLHLVNNGKETHEFTAPTFFAEANIENPQILNRERTEVVVQPAESKDLFLTPRQPGTYDLRCSDHDWNGMVGGITVE